MPENTTTHAWLERLERKIDIVLRDKAEKAEVERDIEIVHNRVTEVNKKLSGIQKIIWTAVGGSAVIWTLLLIVLKSM